jgi:hypothetical protein
MNAQGDDVDAAIGMLYNEPGCASTAPALHTTEAHQRAVAVTCTTPVWQDGAMAWRDASPLSSSFSTTASSSSPVNLPSNPRLDAPSYINPAKRGAICTGEPMAQASRPCGWEQAAPLGAAPPLGREQSCVEAVMEYLDGPLAGNFDFMFD